MLQTTSSMSSRLNCSTIEATVCLCSFICPVRSGDRGLVLLALRNAPSERFGLIGLSMYISDFLHMLFYMYIYLSTLFNNVVSSAGTWTDAVRSVIVWAAVFQNAI